MCMQKVLILQYVDFYLGLSVPLKLNKTMEHILIMQGNSLCRVSLFTNKRLSMKTFVMILIDKVDTGAEIYYCSVTDELVIVKLPETFFFLLCSMYHYLVVSSLYVLKKIF